MGQYDEVLLARIRHILESQKLAVLATEGEEGPYSNIVSFTLGDDLRTLLFATSRSTRKFSNLLHSTRVSLLVDDRNNRIDDFSEAVAVTALGSAWEVSAEEYSRCLEMIMGKHPYLKNFMNSPSIAILKVKVRKYVMVSHFQEVREVIFHEEESNPPL
ncbi:MAG: pyridoxamine 5'-phosphate oxidase family protein [Synergistales bacterium]|nr:pyridoxamine 5'-phosphate oxidase family protein [Synergistales bacterium]